MGRPREHNDETSEALLDAAEHQLRSGGLDGVSLRSISEEAGVSVRAIYSLFDGKNGMIDALAIRAFARLGERVASIGPTADPVADLIEAGRVFYRLAVENPESYRLAWERVFTSDLDANPRWASEAIAARNALRTHIERAFGPGSSSTSDPRQLTAAFHAICQGFASCQVNMVFDGMRVPDPEHLLTVTLRGWCETTVGPADDS